MEGWGEEERGKGTREDARGERGRCALGRAAHGGSSQAKGPRTREAGALGRFLQAERLWHGQVAPLHRRQRVPSFVAGERATAQAGWSNQHWARRVVCWLVAARGAHRDSGWGSPARGALTFLGAPAPIAPISEQPLLASGSGAFDLLPVTDSSRELRPPRTTSRENLLLSRDLVSPPARQPPNQAPRPGSSQLKRFFSAAVGACRTVHGAQHRLFQAVAVWSESRSLLTRRHKAKS
ncbi:hypothetical protein VTN96DRAFT_7494 [Rasamsonia emersonii]